MVDKTTLYLAFAVVALFNFGCGSAYSWYTKIFESYNRKDVKTPDDVNMIRIFMAIRIFLLIACIFLSGFFAYLSISGKIA